MTDRSAKGGLATGAIRTAVFSFTQHDVLQAASDFGGKGDRRRHLMTWGAILFALAVIACPVLIVQVFMPEYSEWVFRDFWAVVHDQKWVLWALAALFVLSFVGRPLLLRYWVWRSFRDNPSQYRNLQFTFGESGIDFSWPNAELHNDWAFYDRVIESKEFFLLAYGGLYVALPKRALLADQMMALKAMLREKIAKYDGHA